MLVKLDAKLQFIDLANVLAHSNTVLLQTTMGAVAQTDQAILNEAHAQGLSCPDKRYDKDTTQQQVHMLQHLKKVCINGLEVLT